MGGNGGGDYMYTEPVRWPTRSYHPGPITSGRLIGGLTTRREGGCCVLIHFPGICFTTWPFFVGLISQNNGLESAFPSFEGAECLFFCLACIPFVFEERVTLKVGGGVGGEFISKFKSIFFCTNRKLQSKAA